MSWCLIESDPGVFTKIISKLGCTGIQVEELHSLQDEDLAALYPIYGLIFLFKWNQCITPNEGIYPNSDNEIYFARQVITNACATQAILSVLLNSKDIEIGSFLREFKDFTKDFSPELKGTAIGDERIRRIHNSFARPEFMLVEGVESSGAKEASFHFTAYVPINGRVFELDGLKSGPYVVGECGEDWTKVAREAISKKMASFSMKELRFNLMAIVKNQKDQFSKKLSELLKRVGVAATFIISLT
jgi:ubiquitin carboxyl-terminal hydrolase L5